MLNAKSLQRIGYILESASQYEPQHFEQFFWPLKTYVEEFLLNELKRNRLDISARPVVDIENDIKAHLAKFPATSVVAQQNLVFYSEFAVGRANSAQHALDIEVSFLNFLVEKNFVNDQDFFQDFGGYRRNAKWDQLFSQSIVFRLEPPVTLDALHDEPVEDEPTAYNTLDDFMSVATSLTSDDSNRPAGLICVPENFAQFPSSVRQ